MNVENTSNPTHLSMQQQVAEFIRCQLSKDPTVTLPPTFIYRGWQLLSKIKRYSAYKIKRLFT